MTTTKPTLTTDLSASQEDASGTAGFTGFPPGAFAFYAGLLQDNSREYWNAHQGQYQACVRDPMLALLAQLEDEFGAGKLFRPNRDVRFSRDKSPYKVHQGAFVKTSTTCGLYVQVDADALLMGGGWYSSNPEQVAHYRRSVLGPAGSELAGLLAALRSSGYQVGGELLKSRPRGVPAEHPHVDLLRHRTLTVHQEFACDVAWIASAQAATHVRRIWADVRPLMAWLGDHATDPGPDQQ